MVEYQIDDKTVMLDEVDENKITHCIYFINGYPAMKAASYTPVYLHRLIAGAKWKQRVTFKDGNRCNLTRSNLVVR